MKGKMNVPKLNKSGLFFSELDRDNSFKDKDNPKGYFVMAIEPLEGFGEEIIYYEKLVDLIMCRPCMIYQNVSYQIFLNMSYFCFGLILPVMTQKRIKKSDA